MVKKKRIWKLFKKFRFKNIYFATVIDKLRDNMLIFLFPQSNLQIFISLLENKR